MALYTLNMQALLFYFPQTTLHFFVIIPYTMLIILVTSLATYDHIEGYIRSAGHDFDAIYRGVIPVYILRLLC